MQDSYWDKPPRMLNMSTEMIFFLSRIASSRVRQRLCIQISLVLSHHIWKSRSLACTCLKSSKHRLVHTVYLELARYGLHVNNARQWKMHVIEVEEYIFEYALADTNQATCLHVISHNSF
jgi:hypothetical protein